MNPRSMRMFGLVATLALAMAACGGASDTASTAAPAATSGTQSTTAASTTVATTAAPTTVATTAATTTLPVTSEVTELSIEAVDNEGFSRTKLTAPAGQISLTFNNKDAGGEPHNWRVTVKADESFATEIRVGPDVQTVTFTIGTPGEYKFICDAHPEAMSGVLTVTP